MVRAVKILKKAALDAKDVERFIHEIDILKTLVSMQTVAIWKIKMQLYFWKSNLYLIKVFLICKNRIN